MQVVDDDLENDLLALNQIISLHHQDYCVDRINFLITERNKIRARIDTLEETETETETK